MLSLLSPFSKVFWTAYTAYHRLGQVRYPFRPLADIERDRDRRVRATVAYAYRWVPYYRETIDRLGLTPGDFRTADDLARLPLIRREQMQRDPTYFVSQERSLDAYVRASNSGSTGTPCAFYYDTAGMCRYAAYYARMHAPLFSHLRRGHGYRKTTILATQRGNLGPQHRFYDRTLWIPWPVKLQRQALSIVDPPEVNVPLINEFRPHVLESSGGYLATLFRYLEDSGERLHGLQAVSYTFDPMPEPARLAIEDKFGLPVLSTYESIEASCMSFACELREHYHVNVDLIPVRITDLEGKPVSEGEPGNVVISNLVLRGSVLLNYMLQDVAAWVPGACACGRSLPRLGRLVGRLDDWLELPSGRRVHPHLIPSIVHKEEGIWQYQVTQESPRRLRFALVAAQGVDREALTSRILERIQEKIGSQVEAEVAFVQDVRRTARGKVRPVISLRTRDWLERSSGTGNVAPLEEEP